MLKANIDNQIKRLNVPDTKKALELWAWVKFDPSLSWAVTYSWEKQRSVAHGGGFDDSATLTTSEAKEDLDTYVLIRHKIVHGDVLPAGSRDGKPRLKRVDADRCLNFFLALVNATSAEARRQFP